MCMLLPVITSALVAVHASFMSSDIGHGRRGRGGGNKVLLSIQRNGEENSLLATLLFFNPGNDIGVCLPHHS